MTPTFKPVRNERLAERFEGGGWFLVGGVRRHVRKPVEGPVRDDDDVGRRRKKKIEKRERRGML